MLQIQELSGVKSESLTIDIVPDECLENIHGGIAPIAIGAGAIFAGEVAKTLEGAAEGAFSQAALNGLTGAPVQDGVLEAAGLGAVAGAFGGPGAGSAATAVSNAAKFISKGADISQIGGIVFGGPAI
jgi:hypothetical protein